MHVLVILTDMAALTPLDRSYLALAGAFEAEYVGQGAANRSLEEILELERRLQAACSAPS